ncbi:MAG: asparaginase [Bacillota bacterium]|nr:asparaginase [Bacillota bacterium]
MSEVLVEVTRGGLVESIHLGSFAIVDTDGRILYSKGDINRTTYLRSATKPLQLIAALELGIFEEFNLDYKELAIISSSHGGENEHIDTIKSLMKKLNVQDSELKCGIHAPLNREAAHELIKKGEKPTKLHCTCSGKHLGQIASAKILGFTGEYRAFDSDVQNHIKNIISIFSLTDRDKIHVGLDGCGAPVYAIPLVNAAKAYANIGNPGFAGGKYSKSQNQLIKAMTMHPEMVGGTGRLDTDLMKNFGDRVIGKFGDEGVYCTSLIKNGIGIALKIEDGASRAVGPTILEILVQMDIIKKDEMEPLKKYWRTPIINHLGEEAGEVRAVFRIDN